MKILDYFFFFRPHLTLCGLAFLFLGLIKSGVSPFDKLPSSSLLSILYFFIALSSINMLNEISDIKSDKHNNKQLLLSKNLITKTESIILFLVLFIYSIFNIRYNTLLLWVLLIGILYSNPFLSLKRYAPFDLLLNSVGFGFVAFFYGYSLNPSIQIQGLSIRIYEILIISLPYMLLMAGVFIATTLPDKKADKKAGYHTSGIVLGKRAKILSAFLILNSCIFAVLLTDYLIFAISLYGLYSHIVAIRKNNIRKGFINTIKGTIVISSLLNFYFLIISVLIFIFTKYYHRHKFNINYP